MKSMWGNVLGKMRLIIWMKLLVGFLVVVVLFVFVIMYVLMQIQGMVDIFEEIDQMWMLSVIFFGMMNGDVLDVECLVFVVIVEMDESEVMKLNEVLEQF